MQTFQPSKLNTCRDNGANILKNYIFFLEKVSKLQTENATDSIPDYNIRPQRQYGKHIQQKILFRKKSVQPFR
jgi:hypothetical protein